MTNRICLGCGRMTTAGSRCPSCSQGQERTRSRRRAPFRLGRYGRAHQTERASWEPVVAQGQVECRRGQRCLRWPGDIRIKAGEEWHLGHPDSECAEPTAPEHALCNTNAAGRGA